MVLKLNVAVQAKAGEGILVVEQLVTSNDVVTVTKVVEVVVNVDVLCP